jgi:DNA-binding response OmpR family regulator
MAIDTLVVDDEPDVRRTTVRILSTAGYACTEAGSVSEARELLACFHYDVALVDLVMPPDSGVDLARSIRADHPDTAIVVVTGVSHSVMASAVLELGVYGYVIKPIIADQLLVTVDNALRRRRLERTRIERTRVLEEVATERATALDQAQRRVAALERALESSSTRASVPATTDPVLERLAVSMAEETTACIHQASVDSAFIERSFADLRGLIELYGLALASATRVEGGEEILRELENARAGADLGLLLDTLPSKAEEMYRAVDVLARMVHTLRTFYVPERELGFPIDVNDAIETTVTAARGLWRHVARLRPELDPTRPLAHGRRRLLARALLGLIVHCRDAIAEDALRPQGSLGVITTRTRREGDEVVLCVAHSGAPLPDDVAAGLSSGAPLVTTPKPLLEARADVVEGLRGAFSLEPNPPRGTCFVITLPAAES